MKNRSIKRLSAILVFMLLLVNTVHAATLTQPIEKLPEIKNIIVLIPDGMNVSCTTLARWYQGGTPLAMDEMASGLVRTYWAGGPITDSAPAATAFSTGYKSTDKYVGVNAKEATMPGVSKVEPADAKKPLVTVIEAAKTKGMATGIVSTSEVQHATPAGYTSHYPGRSDYALLGEQQVYNGLDVVMGGGGKYMTDRADKEDLKAELAMMGYQYVTGRESMLSIKSGKLWGMFSNDAMAMDMDRAVNAPTQPSLAEMTAKAIDLLSRNPNGFILMVEGSEIDWAAHANDPIGIISDTLAFDKAVKVALDFAKNDGSTMVLAMSDHGCGGITIGNSSTSSSYSSDVLSKFLDPLKKAAMTGDGLEKLLNADRSNIVEIMAKYYGITDLSGQEIMDIKNAAAGSLEYTVGPMISKRSGIGWTSGGHTGEEVVLYSYLPGNGRISGVVENTYIAEVVAEALQVDLDALTAETYVDINKALTERGFLCAIDKADKNQVKFFAERGLQTLVIDQNKNNAIVNGTRVTFDSVMVYNGEKFFAPQALIDILAPSGDAPAVPLIQSVGGSATWIHEEQALAFTLGGSTGKLYIGSGIMELNGELVTIAQPPAFVNGRFAISQGTQDFILSLK